jgi:uncharacterized protein
VFFPKDFIETAEGLLFAVVDFAPAGGGEQGKVLCFLRYVREQPSWNKYTTRAANDLLKKAYPHYLFYSVKKDAHLHAVAVDDICHHHRPRFALQNILHKKLLDQVELDLKELYFFYQQHGLNLQQIGVTGSLLVGSQNAESDIDLVIYGRENFQHARQITRKLIESDNLQNLADSDWQLSFERRAGALNYEEYVWHEQRKLNKALINGRKFDLTLIAETVGEDDLSYKKLGKTKILAQVSEDQFAFDYPARLCINHQEVAICVSYTATYSGQAVKGEWVEIAGQLEQSEQGEKRIIVGSTREAAGEYIRVVKKPGS